MVLPGVAVNTVVIGLIVVNGVSPLSAVRSLVSAVLTEVGVIEANEAVTNPENHVPGVAVPARLADHQVGEQSDIHDAKTCGDRMVGCGIGCAVDCAAAHFNRTWQSLSGNGDLPCAGAGCCAGKRATPRALDLDCAIDNRIAYCRYTTQGAGCGCRTPTPTPATPATSGQQRNSQTHNKCRKTCIHEIPLGNLR